MCFTKFCFYPEFFKIKCVKRVYMHICTCLNVRLCVYLYLVCIYTVNPHYLQMCLPTHWNLWFYLKNEYLQCFHNHSDTCRVVKNLSHQQTCVFPGETKCSYFSSHNANECLSRGLFSTTFLGGGIFVLFIDDFIVQIQNGPHAQC